jgi:hypothetical protein
MLKIVDPTLATVLAPPTSAGGVALAFTRKTSRSGSVNITCAPQSRGTSSRHWPLIGSNLTMSPVGGAPLVDPGGGAGSPPRAFTIPSRTVVVCVPELNAAGIDDGAVGTLGERARRVGEQHERGAADRRAAERGAEVVHDRTPRGPPARCPRS